MFGTMAPFTPLLIGGLIASFAALLLGLWYMLGVRHPLPAQVQERRADGKR